MCVYRLVYTQNIHFWYLVFSVDEEWNFSHQKESDYGRNRFSYEINIFYIKIVVDS